MSIKHDILIVLSQVYEWAQKREKACPAEEEKMNWENLMHRVGSLRRFRQVKMREMTLLSKQPELRLGCKLERNLEKEYFYLA